MSLRNRLELDVKNIGGKIFLDARLTWRNEISVKKNNSCRIFMIEGWWKQGWRYGAESKHGNHGKVFKTNALTNVSLMSLVQKNSVFKFACQDIKGYVREGKIPGNETGWCSHLGLTIHNKWRELQRKRNKSRMIPGDHSTDFAPENDR